MNNKLLYLCVITALVFMCLPATASAANEPAGVAYRGHIQDRGDYPSDGSWVNSPEIIGTIGQSKRIEGFEIKLTGTVPEDIELRYNVHVQNKGWLYDEADSAGWPRDGVYAGTRGAGLRIEAVKLVLTDGAGQPVSGYSVQYRGHVQNVGDLPADQNQWRADGEQLGTVGSSLRLEALLVQVVKTDTDPVEPAEPLVYDTVGTFGPEQGSETIAGDVTVAADGVTLQNLVIAGDLTIGEAVGAGNVTLNNVTVAGDTFVRGGGVNSIHINGGQYSRIVMEKTASGAVRIVARDVDGLQVVIAEDAAGETIILEGKFDSVEVNAPNMNVTTQGNTTTIGTMTVTAGAGAATLNLAAGTTVTALVLNAQTAVKGQGNVTRATINADSIIFEKAPGTYTVKPGVVIPPVFPTPNSGGGPTTIAVTGVSLDQQTLNLVYGDTATLTATVVPANATNKAVSFSSSNPAVVTVDAISGEITTVGAGTATITVTTADGSLSASCAVTVQGRLSILDVKAVAGLADNYVTVLLAGDTFIHSSSNFDFNPGTTNLVFGSSIHDSTHYAFGLNNTAAPGTLTLQGTGLTSGINSSTVTITVLPAVTGFANTAFDDSSVSFSWPALTGATTVSLQQQKNGESDWSAATCLISPNSNSTTATVTGLAPATTYQFRLLVNGGQTPGASNLVTVTTKPVATSVSLNKTTANLIVGNYLYLSATVFPANAVNKTVSWSSDKPEFATVDQNGAVTGVAPGTAVISATTANNLVASCSVTVQPVFEASTTGSTVSIDTYNGTNTTVIIPAEIDGKPVTSISANAFKGKTTVTSVTIPDTVTSIGANAFELSGITSVAIPAAVTSIGDGAFRDCANLTTLSFEPSTTLTTIGQMTFQGCKKLTAVTLPDSVTTLGQAAFLQCLALTSINLDHVNTIGENAFFQCNSLIDLVIPNTVSQINGQAFSGCTGLKLVRFEGGPTIQTLSGATFSGCPNLETVIFEPNSQITATGWSLFSGCSKLTSVTLPPMLTEIGNNAFQNNTALTAVTIPGSVMVIGEAAFYNCNKLAVVNFPVSGSDLVIGKNAFNNNKALTSIDLPARLLSIGEGAFHNSTSLTAVNFTAGCKLTSIGKNGFSECPITSLTLPAQLQTINEYSFYNNQLSGTLIIPTTVTAIGVNAFEGNTAGANLTALVIQSTAALSIGDMAFKNHPLTTITMPVGVIISDNPETMGTNGTDFQAAYTAGSNGTYYYSSGWSK